MLVKANISFSGAISMTQGEVKECIDNDVLQDLLQAGYVAPVQQDNPSEGVENDEDKRNNTRKRSKLSKD